MDLIKMLEDLAADKPEINKGKDFITISFKNKKSGRPKTKKYVRHSSKINGWWTQKEEEDDE